MLVRRGLVLLVMLVPIVGVATAPIDRDETTAPPPPARRAPPIRTLPPERGGQDLVGTRLPELRFDAWLPGADGAGPPRPGQPVLYRWWTDTCPYCEASLPGIERLRRRYASRGLVVVAVYHPKPPRQVRDAAVRAQAEARGYHGAVAVDGDWSALRRAYLDTGRRRATSVSILVDGAGVIRFVHPGPVLFPSDDPRHARENRDYELLEAAVRAVLAEPRDHPTKPDDAS